MLSQCLELEPCRHDGEIVRFDLINALEPHVDYRPVCPEVEVGLGVPRDPMRLVASGDRNLLLQTSTGRDLTDEVEAFTRQFLGALKGVDGVILKSRSPSCGPSGVKVFDGMDSRNVVREAPGLFAAAVLDRYGDLAVEDEGRLRNHRIREHFLTRLFALARLREVRESGRVARLVSFHAMYKFVLLAYNKRALRDLGWTVANPGKAPFETVVAEYCDGFSGALARPPRETSVINVLQHIHDFFRKGLGSGEKEHFARQLERYREGQLPATAITTLLESWAVRSGAVYILDQALFAPFPEELASPADSGKGRAAGR